MRLFWAVGLSCALMGCGAGANGGNAAPAMAPKAAAPAKPAELAAAPEAAKPPAAPGPWIGGGTASFADDGSDHVALWVDVPDDAKSAHVPTALTLTIDTSGSMRGAKIRDARKAAQAVVDRLSDGDIVAIHTFADDARVRVSPTVLTPVSRRHIAAVIEELAAVGGTNLFDAIKVAEAETWRVPATHPVRRVVVISDGKATVGPSEPSTIAQLAEVGVSRGVQVSSIGVGLDYDESALNELAIRSSGRLYHLADSSELGAIVEREIALLDRTMATDAVIEVVAAPGVRLGSVNGAHSAWSGGSSLRVPLGALFAGQTREIAVSVRVDPMEGGGVTRPLVSARLHFTDPADGGAPRVQEIVVRAPGSEEGTSLATSERARTILSTFQAAEIAAVAVARANSGDFRAAEAELARAEAALRKTASTTRDDAEKQRVMKRAARIGQSRSKMKAAAKAPPSAQPAATRSGALEANDAALDIMGY